jgi:ABC-type nitrate/sulfonate/bicarbonate transport system substrate-binding protein
MVFHVRIAIILLIIAPVVSTSMAQEKTRIFLGASSKTLGYSPLWVATKKGFFEQQGSTSSSFSCAECR